MATLDLRGATTSFTIDDAEGVKFGAPLGSSPTSTTWTYLNPKGDRVVVTGTGMQFDSLGNPVTGVVTGVSVDILNNGGADLALTGLALAAPAFGALVRGSSTDFWSMALGGDDVILGPQIGGARAFALSISGDGFAAQRGESSGGDDVLQMGDVSFYARGDVLNVGSALGGSTSTYHGGDDHILGLVTDQQQTASGDVGAVRARSTLHGGDDVILIQAKDAAASATGDAASASGRVIGGNDHITGGKDFRGTMAGDVMDARPGGFVTGGDDVLVGGDLNEVLAGDVVRLRGGRLDGGDDVIGGGGGNDVIAGDAWQVEPDGTGSGGDDILRGGGSNDVIHGDFAGGGSGVVGGADRLYGDDGNDRLYGEGGDDVLNGGEGVDQLDGGDGADWLSGGAGGDALTGGAGADMHDGGAGGDRMAGGAGDDTYFVNDFGDVVSELAGSGVDTVWTVLALGALSAEVENLRFNGAGDFIGIGNERANLIAGSTGLDRLEGGAGDDVLIGGAGGDVLIGGLGRDTASYDGATEGVEALLSAPGANSGDAVGDSYVGIESLAGSEFGDFLAGDGGGNVLSGRGGADTLGGGLGADTLRGGAGGDILIGDAGSDVFDFDRADDSPAASRDVIRAGLTAAFEGAGVAGGDAIDLSGIDANTAVAGNQAFLFGGGGVGQVSLTASGNGTLVRANIDNDATFEFQLLIEDGAVQPGAYAAGDFIL